MTSTLRSQDPPVPLPLPATDPPGRTPSPQQQAFLDAVNRDRRHLILRATAGSGKTSTLIHAAWQLSDEPGTMYFAYNKHAAQDVAGKLPPAVKARTLHGHGLSILGRQDLTIQPDKAALLAAERLDEQDNPGGAARREALIQAIVRAFQMQREQLLLSADPGLAERSRWNALKPGSDALSHWERRLAGHLSALERRTAETWQHSGLLDYTDMLWLPWRLGLGFGQITTAIVDEAQDLTPLRWQFLFHVTGALGKRPGRMLACGDPSQSIYQFSGADPQGLTRAAKRLNAELYPLSVSWRCAREIVRAAQVVSDFIQPAPSAPAGEVRQVQGSQVNWARGEAVICRYNAPLLKLGLELLHRGLPVMLNGRQLAEAVTRLASEALPATFSSTQLSDVLKTLRTAQQQQHVDKHTTARADEQQRDLIDSLEILAQQTCQSTGHGSLNALTQQLTALSQPGGIELSTIHRAKGREWPQVTLLNAEHFLATVADADETLEESCVLFVALTRAKSRLTLAYSDEAWEDRRRLLRSTPALAALPRTRPPAAEPVQAGNLPLQLDAATPLLRQYPLYSGPDALSAGTIRQVLGPITRSLRPTFAQWAEEALEHLRRQPEGVLIHIDAQRLRLAEQQHQRSRMAIPVISGLQAQERAVLLTVAGLARWKAAAVLSQDAQHVRVQYGPDTWAFGPDGELHAQPFHPAQPYLRP